MKTQIDKIAAGLECCLRSVEKCVNCPYHESDTRNTRCKSELHDDALEILGDYDLQLQYRNDVIYEEERENARLRELLKEKEPRMLTLNEVKASKGSDLYLEMHGYPGEEPYITAATLDGVGTHGVAFYHNTFDFDTYNHNSICGWRCWTAKPSREQRKEVEWDDKT